MNADEEADMQIRRKAYFDRQSDRPADTHTHTHTQIGIDIQLSYAAAQTDRQADREAYIHKIGTQVDNQLYRRADKDAGRQIGRQVPQPSAITSPIYKDNLISDLFIGNQPAHRSRAPLICISTADWLMARSRLLAGDNLCARLIKPVTP